MKRCEICGRFCGRQWGRCFDCNRLCCRACKPAGYHLCTRCWDTADGREADALGGPLS